MEMLIYFHFHFPLILRQIKKSQLKRLLYKKSFVISNILLVFISHKLHDPDMKLTFSNILPKKI